MNTNPVCVNHPAANPECVSSPLLNILVKEWPSSFYNDHVRIQEFVEKVAMLR